jgi:hypothetical protein
MLFLAVLDGLLFSVVLRVVWNGRWLLQGL